MADNDKNYFDPKVLAGIANLGLRARWVVEGLLSGVHKSRAKGFSVEFEEHREYSPGDEIRRIDWKALGKFDRYMIKEYEDETNLRAYLLVDGSASMNYASDGITKFDYACTLTASLAYLILKQQDAAGIVTFSNKVESFIPRVPNETTCRKSSTRWKIAAPRARPMLPKFSKSWPGRSAGAV
jgi:uncharacterized protein (DUF58 family)